jgi:TonB-linked SusC/RagA family outer membrane protein
MIKYITFTLMLINSAFIVLAQDRQVSGQITDAQNNQPLTGVTVQVQNQETATTTGPDGKFALTIPAGHTTLSISYVGYRNIKIPVAAGQKNISVSMETDGQLSEVVVTAMGIKKEQRKLGYATSTITSQEVIKTAPTNFASALYGKAPGVTINTNPGGSTSAVSVQIRGINSISGQRQPLLVVDGIVIRNGDASNEGYWGGNQRLNGNGLLDINPENIESINILKGAAGSALYGSDANFGVIVITTKSGRKSNGLGVDLNLSANKEQLSVAPDLQTTYGPGYDRATNMSAFGADDEGWIHMNVGGQDVVRPIFRAYAQFGPKADGRQAYWWDGQMRSYKSQGNNWQKFYRDGSSSIANIALTNASDKYNYRFSYTRNDYKGIQIGGKQEKNTFNLNTTYRINSKLSTDLVINYINEKVQNRPRQMARLTNAYDGFFSPVDYMDVYFNKYKTSKGYKWVDWNQTQLDPAEAIKYNIRAKEFLDFLWTQLENSYAENSNRLIASATVNYNIIKGLNFRGRFGTDYTGYYLTQQDKSTQPIAFGASGSYSNTSNQFAYNYGDLLLSYETGITHDLNLSLSAGYQARKEMARNANAYTVNGLTTENWFTLNASKDPARGGSSRRTLVKDGLFGILGIDYKNYLFVEGTLRQERTSTLFPGKNIFYYPGVSGAFELSNAFSLPAFVSYSKLRAAYGIVGNPPDEYKANVVYNAGNINGIPALYPRVPYGNNDLKNEMKREVEFGWDTRLFNNRFGFDVSYYNNRVVDQVLNLTLPATTGSTEIVVNVGTLRNHGVELGLNGVPVRTKNFQWDTRLNLAFNKNKVESLMSGLERLTNANLDNGSLLVVSEIGKPAGDIVGYKRRVDAGGNYMINADGYYDINFDEQVKMGNIQPKAIGGFINNFSYQNFNLNMVIDFRYGGQIVSQALLYGTGAGLYKNSLYGRDAQNGGIAYYQDQSTGKFVKAGQGSTAGPNGEKIYNDGMILKGNGADGKPNEVIIDAPNYYLNTYSWGSWPGSGSYSTYEGAVFNNDFVKMRELSLSYSLPVKLRSKVKAQNFVISVYGRNLFYIYKALPYLDPEEGVGTNWINQAISTGGGTAATRSYGASIRLTF